MPRASNQTFGRRNEADTGGRTLGQFRDLVRKAAMDRGLEVFEGPDLLPPGPRWLADGTHLDDLAFAILTDRWASALRARGMVPRA